MYQNFKKIPESFHRRSCSRIKDHKTATWASFIVCVGTFNLLFLVQVALIAQGTRHPQKLDKIIELSTTLNR